MRIVSALFVDLVDFTPLTEARDDEDVRELLSRYFDVARTIVGRHRGTLEKFIGDAVVAVWGVPTAREDDAERAVRAGLEIVEAVGASGLDARAAVVTGQAVARASADEGLVVGDRINTAARAQAVADPGTVYVDDVTRQATAAAIAYDDTGEHALKGKSAPVRLWRAGRVGGRRAPDTDPPLVGRESELRLLKELFHAGVDRGVARLVAVSGPAGVGKSRLRSALYCYTDGLAGTVLWHTGRCLSYGDGIAYWALAEMVRRRLGVAEDAPVEETVRRLDAGLERWILDADERAFLAPRLGARARRPARALGHRPPRRDAALPRAAGRRGDRRAA